MGNAERTPGRLPFPMPARLADGLGLESGPGESRAVRPSLVFLHKALVLPAPGLRKEAGFRLLTAICGDRPVLSIRGVRREQT